MFIVSDPVRGPVWPRGWVEVQLYSSMTAALEGGEWSATRPAYVCKVGNFLFEIRPV